jgi:hypothetical protein
VAVRPQQVVVGETRIDQGVLLAFRQPFPRLLVPISKAYVFHGFVRFSTWLLGYENPVFDQFST